MKNLNFKTAYDYTNALENYQKSIDQPVLTNHSLNAALEHEKTSILFVRKTLHWIFIMPFTENLSDRPHESPHFNKSKKLFQKSFCSKT
jgi:hypothetical protein